MGATDSNCCGGGEQPNRFIEQEMNSSRQKHDKNKRVSSPIEQNTEIKHIKDETIQMDEYILHKDSPQYLSLKRMNTIKVNDQIDYRNDYGKFMGYNVLDKKGTILTLENCNDDEKGDTTIHIDYSKAVNRFAEYGSISKREAHRFLDLVMEDYIDIKKDGWRYGEIIEIDKFSGQIQVGFLDSDGNYDDYWFHLDNEFEVAKCNTKCDIIMSLKQHIYDPFFNIKKHKNDGKLMMERLRKCFVYIETEILPEKIKEGRLSFISYLNDVYFQLYIESIACEMNGSMSNDDMKKMKELFVEKYDPLLETLKTETDEMQLWLKPQDIEINTENDNDNEEKKDEYYDLSKLREIKVKWSMRIFDIKFIDDKHCEENTCISIKRINYILDLFEEYYINSDREDNTIAMKKPDFMMIYNKCISDHYSIAQLLNDFHHLQVYHEENILKDANVINQCKIKECKVNKESKQIDYKELHEIQVMKNIIKMHICFQHKIKMKKSDLPMLLNVESNEPQTSITRRDTSEMLSKSSTNGRSASLNRRMIGRPTELIFSTKKKTKFQTEVKQQDVVTKMPSFEFGQRFYYNKYFKDSDNYIAKPKYASLKEEILSNRIHRTQLSILEGYLWKATHHSLSNKAKQLKSKYYGLDNQIFEIPAHLPITISHLLCIILYTDDDTLQKRYKKYGCRYNEYTTHGLGENTALEKLKRLNGEIGWWYSLFYEAVLFYGKDAAKKDVFYHGLSVKLLFGSFTPTFRSPISTTVSYDIGLRFGGDGIILLLTPTDSSQDRYFDVEWISVYPNEKERVFCQAHSLYIYDMLFKEKGACIREISTPNHIDISSLRLFDYIVNQNLEAPKKLFAEKQQERLSKYFKTRGNKQKMDAIKDFNDTNHLCMVNELFSSQEYDSECIDFDLDNDDGQSIIRTRITEQKDDDRINRLVSFINEYDEEHAEIPQYLKDLFDFMIEKLNKNKAIYMIKSQYNKLNIDLQLKFMELLSTYDVEYTQEFEWKIEGESFTEFMNLIPQTIQGTTYKRSNAFEFKYIDIENKEQTISFIPQITRIDPSWPKYCSIGIKVGTISCNIASFHWSFGMKEIDYSCDVDIYVENAENGTYDGIKAFKNVKLKKLKRLTLTIYMRRDIGKSVNE